MSDNYVLDELFPSKITKISSNHKLISPTYKLTSRHDRQRKILQDIIDFLGAASARVQNLPQVITSFSKFKYTDHRIYFIRELPNPSDPMPFGFLKVGRKKLFIFDCFEEFHEVDPICVLDFYVSDNFQRKGFGQCLFQAMLADENVSAASLAIDSPSEKMLSFMRKHYHLENPLWQSNNFVVYPEFFRVLKRSNHSDVSALRQPVARISLVGDCLRQVSNETSSPLTLSGKLPPIVQHHPTSPSALISPVSYAVSNSSNQHSETGKTSELPTTSPQLRNSPIKDEAEKTYPNTSVTDPILPSSSNRLDLETWRRLSSIPRNYSYQSAVRMHNKHTRLW